MIYIWLNVLAIVGATGSGLAAGALYHRLFGKRSGGRITPGFLLVAIVAQAWFAAILAGALILAPKQAGIWQMTIGSAVVIWIGFVVPVLAVTHGYRGMKIATIAKDCGYWLSAMLVQVLVLQTIGLVPPPA